MDSEKASYKQKLDVLKEQQELIDDEAEQEQKEQDARRAEREAAEVEARLAQSLLPDSEVRFIPSGRNAQADLFILLVNPGDSCR